MSIHGFLPAWVLHSAAIAIFKVVSCCLAGIALALGEATTRLPAWAVLVVAATIAYVLVNSVVCTGLIGEVTPIAWDTTSSRPRACASADFRA